MIVCEVFPIVIVNFTLMIEVMMIMCFKYLTRIKDSHVKQGSK